MHSMPIASAQHMGELLCKPSSQQTEDPTETFNASGRKLAFNSARAYANATLQHHMCKRFS